MENLLDLNQRNLKVCDILFKNIFNKKYATGFNRKQYNSVRVQMGARLYNSVEVVLENQNIKK
jgi:hypothetical protein